MAQVREATALAEMDDEIHHDEVLEEATEPAPDPKPAKPKRSRGLPQPPSFNMKPKPFYAYTASLTEEDYGRIQMYMYRLVPKIIRTPSNIDKPAGAIDEQYILDNHGSGKYQIKLNDLDKKATLCRCIVEIDNPDYPPKFDIRELDVKSETNRLIVEQLKREGKLTVEGSVITPAAAPDPDATMASALEKIALEAMRGKNNAHGFDPVAMGKFMEMTASVSNKSIEMLIDKLKSNDKGGDTATNMMLQIMLKQMELADKRASVPPPAADTTLVTLLMAMLDASTKRNEAMELRLEADRKEQSAERQRQHELQLKAIEQRGDPMEMIDKVLNIKERLGADAEPDNRKWPEKLVDGGLQILPEILATVKQMGYAAQQRAQAQPADRTAENAPRPAAEPERAITPEVVSQNGEPTAVADPEIEYLHEVFLAQGQNFVNAFRNDPNGGPDLARTVTLFAGVATYERIARCGREKIMQAVDTIPQMKADLLAVGTLEMIHDFIDGFIDPDEDGDEDVPEIPVAEPPPGNAAIPMSRGRKKAGAK